jgi:uncharacterized protein
MNHMNPNLEKVLAKIRAAQLTEFVGMDAKLKDPNEKGLFGTTPLHIVAIWGDIEAARVLLDAGAEIDVPAEEDCTALHEAINQGHFEMVEFLVSRGADLKRKCRFGNALELATLCKSKEIKKFVRERVQ